MPVSIQRQQDFLIASIHAALDDAELLRFQQDVVAQIGKHRSRGVIIDVAALDVMDSFGSRSLRDLVHASRLRGAKTVIVGIQPEVAFAIVQLGMSLDVPTVSDLEEGLEFLGQLTTDDRPGRSTLHDFEICGGRPNRSTR